MKFTITYEKDEINIMCFALESDPKTPMMSVFKKSDIKKPTEEQIAKLKEGLAGYDIPEEAFELMPSEMVEQMFAKI